MTLQTEYEFKLPRGYVDAEGNLHKEGVMKMATALDEIIPMRDGRVKENPDYASILVLSRVIIKLGTLSNITPEMIENLFISDMNFLQNMYQTINEAEDPIIHVQCPHCGRGFTDSINFSKME